MLANPPPLPTADPKKALDNVAFSAEPKAIPGLPKKKSLKDDGKQQ